MTIFVAGAQPGQEVSMNKQNVNMLAPLLSVTNISGTAATFNWNTSFAVTKIVVTPATGADIQVPIPNASAGTITVSTLSPTVFYTAKIYVGEKAGNAKSFRTWYTIPAGATNVAPSATPNDGGLGDAITAAADGAVLVLSSGNYYLSTTPETGYALAKSFTLLAATPDAHPVVYVPGKNFTVGTGATASSFKFIGVDLAPANAAGVMEYMIRVTSGTTVNITSLEFRDCRIGTIARCLWRSENTTANQTLGTFVIDNSVITNTFVAGQNYNLFHFSATSSDILPTQYTITNSTFNGITGLIGASAVTGGTKSSTMDVNNNTIYRLGNGSSTSVMINTRAAGDLLRMGKCIFGGASTSGYTCINVTGAKTISDCYYTSTVTAGGLTGIDALNKADAAVFKSPAATNAADFTLIEQNMITNKIGDPRWVPAQ